MDQSRSAIRALVLLVVIAVAARAALFLVYQPVVYPDTGTYHTLASQILNFDFSDYRAVRTPAYSLLLLLGYQNHFLVWLIQSTLGVLISILLFWICLSHTGNSIWALCAGLAHTLALNQLFFEANVLSETLSTFLIVLSVASLIAASKRRHLGYGAWAGFASAFATLTRPVYIYLGPLFALLLLLFERDGKRLAASVVVAFILPVLGWAAFNKATIGQFALSTNMGYGLTNHSGRFIEHAGDEYATIRDIYLKHREKKIAETGSSAVTIFLARDEMREQTGLDDIALSRRLTELSLALFMKYPSLYLKSVAEAWASFWAAPLYMRPDKFKTPGAAKLIGLGWPPERMLLLVANLLAVVASGWVMAAAVVRRVKGTYGMSIPLIVSCVVIGASVVQALFEYGENPRYGIPTQSLAVTLVLLVAWDLRAALKARSAADKRQAPAVLEV